MPQPGKVHHLRQQTLILQAHIHTYMRAHIYVYKKSYAMAAPNVRNTSTVSTTPAAFILLSEASDGLGHHQVSRRYSKWSPPVPCLLLGSHYAFGLVFVLGLTCEAHAWVASCGWVSSQGLQSFGFPPNAMRGGKPLSG